MSIPESMSIQEPSNTLTHSVDPLSNAETDINSNTITKDTHFNGYAIVRLWPWLFFGYISLLSFNSILVQLPFLSDTFSTAYAFWFPLSYSIASNLIQLSFVWFGQKLTFSQRVFVSVIALFTIQLLYLFSTVFLKESIITIGIILGIFLGLFTGICQNAGFGLSANGDNRVMTYFVVGQGLSGLVLWPILILFHSTTSDRATFIIFFLFTALCTMMFLPVYFAKCHHVALSIESSEAKLAEDNGQPHMFRRTTRELVENTTGETKVQIISTTRAVFSDIYKSAIEEWATFCITFVVFPGQVSKFEANEGASYSSTFLVSFLIYLFQIFDVCGRFGPEMFVITQKYLSILVWSRLIFIPLFILVPQWNVHDGYKIVLMVIFAYTHGLANTWPMIYGPTYTENERDRDIAGYIMGFSLVFGILCGSLIGLIALNE